jgi:serine/threonine protein kinase
MMQNIPGYTITGKIAEGGCAQLFAGVEQASGKRVAVKLLHPHNLSNKIEFKRLVEEGKLMMKLRHDNLVRAYATGVAGELPYLVLEYVQGRSLRDLVAEKYMLTNGETLRLARALCQGVRYLHDLGFLHKDIKPDNLMLGDAGEIKLVDFGFAEPVKPSFSLFGGSKRLEGSPAYMAPELLTTKKASPATDIYAIGCTLYEACAGRSPFEGMSDQVTMAQQTNLRLSAEPIQAKNGRISAMTEKMIQRALQKDPAQRYKLVDEMMLDIARNPATNDPKSSARMSPALA